MKNRIILWNQSSNPHVKNSIIDNGDMYTDVDEKYEMLYAHFFDTSYNVIFQKGNLVIMKKEYGDYIVSGNYNEKDVTERRLAFSACVLNHPWKVLQEIKNNAEMQGRHLSIVNQICIFYALNRVLIWIMLLSIFILLMVACLV